MGDHGISECGRKSSAWRRAESRRYVYNGIIMMAASRKDEMESMTAAGINQASAIMAYAASNGGASASSENIVISISTASKGERRGGAARRQTAAAAAAESAARAASWRHDQRK